MLADVNSGYLTPRAGGNWDTTEQYLRASPMYAHYLDSPSAQRVIDLSHLYVDNGFLQVQFWEFASFMPNLSVEILLSFPAQLFFAPLRYRFEMSDFAISMLLKVVKTATKSPSAKVIFEGLRGDFPGTFGELLSVVAATAG